MKKILYNIPIHSFLLAPVLIFFLFVHNYSLNSFHSTIRSYTVAIIFSCSIFILFYFLFGKNKHKAGVVTTVLMLILFFYGFVYEIAEKMFYKGWWPFTEIHRYLLLSILIFSCVIIYFLFKTRQTFYPLTLSLNVFVLILFCINLGQLSSTIIKNSSGEVNISIPANNTTIKKNDSLPDIYYIILDGYAQDSVLSATYNYTNNPLTVFLKKNNFYVASGSRTNYISTGTSLSSSLNFSYLDSLTHAGSKNLIYENKVSEYLKKKGYKIVHVRSGFSVTRENYYADTTLALENLGEFERTLLQYTIFRLDDLLGYARYNTLKEQLNVINNAITVSGPKYTFIHIVSPHPPYICDENGNYKTSPRIINTWWEPKSDYIAQLKYINKETINIISDIFKKSKIDPIVLIQSDHGPWTQTNSFRELYNARSRILNAYYTPQRKNKLYSTITPVNSFRYIFNELFNDSIPLLPDIPLDSGSVAQNANSNLMTEE